MRMKGSYHSVPVPWTLRDEDMQSLWSPEKFQCSIPLPKMGPNHNHTGGFIGRWCEILPQRDTLHGIQVTFLSEPQVCKGFTSLFRLFSWVSKSFEGPEVLFPVCSHRRSSQNAYSCYFGYCWRSAGFLYSAILNLTKMLFRVVDPVLIQSPQSSSQTPVSTLTSCTIDSTSYLQILCHTYQSFWQSMYFRVRS